VTRRPTREGGCKPQSLLGVLEGVGGLESSKDARKVDQAVADEGAIVAMVVLLDSQATEEDEEVA
jgi:hypothetical protein